MKKIKILVLVVILMIPLYMRAPRLKMNAGCRTTEGFWIIEWGLITYVPSTTTCPIQ